MHYYLLTVVSYLCLIKKTTSNSGYLCSFYLFCYTIMLVYLKEERIDIIGECLQNCLPASRIYAVRFLKEIIQIKHSKDCWQYLDVLKVFSMNNLSQNIIASVIENPIQVKTKLLKISALVKQAYQEFSKNTIAILIKSSFTKKFTKTIMGNELNFVYGY